MAYFDGFGQPPGGCYIIPAEQEDSNGQTRPANQYTDMDYGPGQFSPELGMNNPSNPNGEFIYTYLMRDLDKYFNARFQTYDRHVHLFVYYGQAGTGPNGCPTSEQRTGDASDNFQRIHPFAVVDFSGPNRAAYEDYMAYHGVVVFSGHHINGPNEGHHNSDFQKYPGLIWSFEPTLEELGGIYVSYVCKNLVGKDATLSPQFYSPNPSVTGGTPSATPGQNLPRKFGFLEPVDPNYPDLTDYALTIYNGIKKCGGQFDSYIATFNRADLDVDMYGRRQHFEGRISGFTMGTGSTLALLPAENATGNYVKVVQRLPVRIDLVNYNPDAKPLFIGLSVTPYVYIDEPPSGPNAGKVLQPPLTGSITPAPAMR